jgi:hypothetical protein
VSYTFTKNNSKIHLQMLHSYCHYGTDNNTDRVKIVTRPNTDKNYAAAFTNISYACRYTMYNTGNSNTSICQCCISHRRLPATTIPTDSKRKHVSSMLVIYMVVGLHSVVGIVICYRLDGSVFEPQWGRNFPHPPRPAPRPTQPHV